MAIVGDPGSVPGIYIFCCRIDRFGQVVKAGFIYSQKLEYTFATEEKEGKREKEDLNIKR